MVKVLIHACSILLLVTISSCAESSIDSRNDQIQQMNRQIETQQQEIQQLKQSLSNTGVKSSVSTNASDSKSSPPVPGWTDAKNWAIIQRGMSPQQVISILGKPTRTDDSGILILKYFWEGQIQNSGFVSGNIWFNDNQVFVSHPPVF